MSLFHYREVRAEVRVKYLVEAQSAESGHHFACYYFAGREAKRLSEGDACRGGSLDDNIFVWIPKGVEDLLRIILLAYSGSRAHRDTLAAVCACDLVQAVAECGLDKSLESAVDKCVDIQPLMLMACPDASAAKYALVGVAYMLGLLSSFSALRFSPV